MTDYRIIYKFVRKILIIYILNQLLNYMKKIKWMLLLSLMMITGSAHAEWVNPDPLQYKATEIESSENENGKRYYMYSAAHGSFIGHGNQWSVEATFDNAAPKMYFFTKYVKDGEEWDGVSYRFNSFISKTSVWDHMWITGGYVIGDCTMGQGSCRGDDYWCFEWQEDGTALVYVADYSAAYGETALGYKAYMAASPNFPTINRVGLNVDGFNGSEAFTENVSWAFIEESQYEAYNKAKALYDKSEELLNAIWDAEEKNDGIDLSSVKAVYDNTSSTMEELQAAIEAIPGIVRAFVLAKADGATLDAPADFTQLLATPDYAVGNANGWKGDVADIVDGSAQLWNKVDTFNFYQELTEVPNGIYRVNVQGLWRVGNTGDAPYVGGEFHNPELLRAFVYGESDGVKFRRRMMGYLDDAQTYSIHDTDYEYPNGLFVPNRQAGFTVWADEGYYAENEAYVVVTDNTLRLGLYCDYIIYSGSWCVFDNWKLEYCGNAEAGSAVLGEQLIGQFEYDEEKTQAVLREQYEEKVSAIEGASSLEEIMAASEGLFALQDSIVFNIAAFNQYLAAVEEVKAYLDAHQDFAGPDREYLEQYFESDEEPGTYPNGGYVYIVENTPLTTAQLEAEAAYVRELLETAIHNNITEGTDITHLLKNASLALPDFEGWTINKKITDNFKSGTGEKAFPVAQAFSADAANFNVYQTIDDMPDGVYEVNVNALFRWSAGEWDQYDDKVVPVVLYLNDFSTPVKNGTADAICEDEAVDSVNCLITNGAGSGWPWDLVTERDGKQYYGPNSVQGCSFAFMSGRYKQTVYGLVTDGKMTLGLRDDRTSSSEWTVFSNFKLTYQGKNPEAMAVVLEDLQAKADAYVKAAEAQGTSFCMEYYNNIQTIAEQFNATDDIETKYNGLIAINEELKKIALSAPLYEQLLKKLDLAYGAYWDKLDAGECTQDEIDVFEAEYYNPLTDAMMEGALTNEQCEAAIQAISTLPVIDVIYVYGDLVNQGWGDYTSNIYPLTRQEDGTYQGTFESLNRTTKDGYGNRSGVFFGYQGEYLSNATGMFREVTGKRQTFTLGSGSGNWYYTYGGKWKVTISADRSTMTIEPEGEPVYPPYFYVVGDLVKGYWNRSNNEPLAHVGNGLYTGVAHIGNAATTDASAVGRFTIFAGEWPIAYSWTEARLGTGTGNVTLPVGETVSGVARGYGECAWVLEPGTYVITVNFQDQTIKATPLDVAGEGTPETPYLVSSLNDFETVRALVSPEQTTYVRVEADIDMTGVEDWTPLFPVFDNATAINSKVEIDGQNHIISNFHATKSFFGALCGTIRNIGFDYAVVESEEGNGIIAKSAGHRSYINAQALPDTTIFENVWVRGQLTVGSEYAGALAGRVVGPTIVRNCYTDVKVAGEAEYMGGLFGKVIEQLNISQAYAAGSIAQGGGIIGGGQAETTPASVYDNIVVWNNTEENFGPTMADKDITLPVADLLDLAFDTEKIAVDKSPMNQAIEIVGEPKVAYSEKFGKNVFYSEAEENRTPISYLKLSYADNQALKDALTDGFTIETTFKILNDTYPGDVTPMRATESGGYGFDVTSNGQIKFVARTDNTDNEGDNNYRYAPTNVYAKVHTYYHMVGVYNKEENKVYCYVNGTNAAEGTANGELAFPSDAEAQWMGIGADCATATGSNGANFEIVSARIYNEPINAATARALYYNEFGGNFNEGDKQTNIVYYNGSNFASLQGVVVNWGNPWTCDMKDGSYPVFGWDTTGATAIESVEGNMAATDNVKVYSLNGQMLFQGQLKDAKLNKGVYVISNSEKSYKVVLP